MTSYISVEDMKQDQVDVNWSGALDLLATNLIKQASRLIDEATFVDEGAYKVETATTRYFDGSGKRELRIDPIAETPDSVEVNESADMSTYVAWASTDYYVWPYNKTPYRKLVIDALNGTKAVWFKYPRAVKVTAKFGFSTTPPELVKRAVTTQATRWLMRAQQGYQDVGAIEEIGQLRYVKQLDPDVQAILNLIAEPAI